MSATHNFGVELNIADVEFGTKALRFHGGFNVHGFAPATSLLFLSVNSLHRTLGPLLWSQGLQCHCWVFRTGTMAQEWYQGEGCVAYLGSIWHRQQTAWSCYRSASDMAPSDNRDVGSAGRFYDFLREIPLHFLCRARSRTFSPSCFRKTVLGGPHGLYHTAVQPYFLLQKDARSLESGG